MANLDNPRGLRPFKHLLGQKIIQNAYTIADAYTTSIFCGDIVTLTGTGRNIVASAGTASTPEVENIGVFAGCEYTDANGKRVFGHYYPGSASNTDIVAYVWDDPNIVFRVQANTVAVGDVGTLVDITDATAGSATTGNSLDEADGTTGFGTTGKQLRVLGLVDEPGNDYGANADIMVVFAEHILGTGAAGAGGV